MQIALLCQHTASDMLCAMKKAIHRYCARTPWCITASSAGRCVSHISCLHHHRKSPTYQLNGYADKQCGGRQIMLHVRAT